MSQIRASSIFFERHERPLLHEFRDYIGQEVIVGLEGKNQHGSRVIGYVSGVVGLDEGKHHEVSLYEIVDPETFEGVADKILPLDGKTPIVEAFFPKRVERWVQSDRDLEVVVSSRPRHQIVNTYRF